MTSKYLLVFFVALIGFAAVDAQEAEIYPTHWWAGMKWNKVQLLLRGSANLSDQKIQIRYPGISITKVHKLENGKYLAIDISISPAAKPGTVSVELEREGRKSTVPWLLKPRRKGNGSHYAQGVHSSDFIYFLMPDRFSNGDPSNDRIEGLRDQSLNRDSTFHRNRWQSYLRF